MSRDGSRHAGGQREAQLMSPDEVIVYEAIATVRRPMSAGDLVATTGLEEATVRSALKHLAELGMTVEGRDGTGLGPNDWDVRGTR